MKNYNPKGKNNLITLAVGLVYFWFGALKFVPDMSPAEELAKNTIHELTFGLVPDGLSIILLAIWEVGLGILLVFGRFRGQAVILGLVHMVCTFSPLLFFPNEIFGDAPLSLTLVGQYIMKNLIIIAALVSVYERKQVAPIGSTPLANKKQSFINRVWVAKILPKKV